MRERGEQLYKAHNKFLKFKNLACEKHIVRSQDVGSIVFEKKSCRVF